MKKLLFVIAFTVSLLMPNQLKASPYMGGEITWECIPVGQPYAGKFFFYLRLYRDCDAISYGQTQTLYSTSPAGNIYLTLISGYPKNLSTGCKSSSFSGVNFIDCNSYPSNGAVTEYLYKSAPVEINGIPPAIGWTFYLTSCCRNYADNFSGYPNYFIRSKMYPYNNNNVYPCFDNSPQFVEPAQPIVSGGYPAVISNATFDKELDSLVYEWGVPMVNSNTTISYNTSYSYTHPLPGPSQNINNVSATINPKNGFIYYESHTEGMFLTCIKVSSYRCGQLVAENWREILVNIKNQTNNSPPIIDIGLDSNNNLIDTVVVGDIVSFPINVNDIQFLPDGNMQTVTFNAFSTMFGTYIPANGSTPATYSSTTGCIQPPCATLTPAPSAGIPITGNFGTTVQFNWTVECAHTQINIGCGLTSNVHEFYYKVKDDYCPLPANNFIKHTIVVMPVQYKYSTEIQCINKLQNNNFEVKWNPINDTTGRFLYYIIHFINPDDIETVDTIYNMGENTYIYNNSTNYDYIKCSIETKANFSHISNNSSLIKNLELSSVVYEPCQANLQWPALSNSMDSIYYKIFRKTENTPWTLIDSTTSLLYLDVGSLDQNFYYKIQSEDVFVYDSLGNHIIKNSSSNIIGTTKFLNIGSDTTICINHNLTLNSNGFNATIYQWSNGSTDSYIDIMASDLGLGSHNIWLNATNATACNTSDTVTITVEACTSIKELDNKISIEISPNPSDGMFIIKMENMNEDNYSLEIIDMKAAVIIKEEILEKEFKIDLSSYPAGNYLLRIKSKEYNTQQKLILK